MAGWKAVNPFPHVKKGVIIVGPHTSNWDFIWGVAFRSVLKLNKAKFLGKAELFKPPFGFIFRGLGGTPVDRSGKHGVVEQVVEKFNVADSLLIALSPEGTRKKVDRLRTGFYHIAKKAGVPIIMVGLDYAKKELSVAAPFYVSDNEAADFNTIISFYAPLRGKRPALGMSHLQ
jgi:1-acyl-sn-glycerol-3-phosphate acyltransferase